MIKKLEEMIKDRVVRNEVVVGPLPLPHPSQLGHQSASVSYTFEIVNLGIYLNWDGNCYDIELSADETLLHDLFPETISSEISTPLFDGQQIIRFPLHEFFDSTVPVLTRILNAGFTVEACSGGAGIDYQHSGYLLVRKSAI